MCSRYEIDVEWEIFVEQFGLDGAPDDFPPGDIRPTNAAPVLCRDGLKELQWGIPAPWDGKPLINARAETLQEKATFRPLLQDRCLVPASAYFEWRKDGKVRLKNRISLADRKLMIFAGLISAERFTIITCPPTPSIAHIHGRMPVILPQAAQNLWGDPGRSFSDVQKILKPYDAGPLIANEDVPAPAAQADLFG